MSELTPEDAALIERHRAFLDRRDAEWAKARRRRYKAEWQARYNKSERGREVTARYRASRRSDPRPPTDPSREEQRVARERYLQTIGGGRFPYHVDPVLDLDGLRELQGGRW